VLIAGGKATVSVAMLLIAPAGASVDEMGPVALFRIPAAVPVTFTENVQNPLAARLAPARLMVLDPAVAVIVPPPQLPVSPLGVATCSPEGSVSLNAIPVRV